MNPIILGGSAALCWGTLDFLAGRASNAIGAGPTTAGVTVAGLAILSLWLALNGSFPGLMLREIWMPVSAGAAFALATLWFFTAISSGPVSLAVPIGMAYPASAVILSAAIGH